MRANQEICGRGDVVRDYAELSGVEAQALRLYWEGIVGVFMMWATLLLFRSFRIENL